MFKVLKTAAITSLAAFSMTATLGGAAYAQSSSQFDTARGNSQFSNSNQRGRNNNDQLAGGLIGALAGGVVGSQVAGRGSRTEGALIGGLLGGVAGAAIADNDGRSSRRNSGFNRSSRYNRGYYNQRSYGRSSYGYGGRSSYGYNSRNSYARGSSGLYRSSRGRNRRSGISIGF